MATCSSNLDGKANVGSGGGGGGPDTYTAPNEYFVDPGLGADATKRQYQTIDAALAAGTSASDDPIVIRLAEGSDHDWNGSNLAEADLGEAGTRHFPSGRVRPGADLARDGNRA